MIAAEHPAVERAESVPATKKKAAPLHIPSLDGLRAVSFFIVFVAHAGLDRIVPGGFGVTVFFFLSGYLITTLMRLEADGSGQVHLKNFYLRRALRILPPFYIVLLAAIGLAIVDFLHGQTPPQAGPITSQLLHVSNYWIAAKGWNGVPMGTAVYWSLAVEEHFYLVFPAVFLLFRWLRFTGKHQAIAFWALCAVILAWRCILVFGMHAAVERTYLCSDTRIDSILFGCALAVWNNPVLDKPAGGRAPSGLMDGILCLVGMALLLVTFVVRGSEFRESFRYTIQGIGLTPIFIAVIRWPQFPAFRPLNWKPVRYIGSLTFTLYLVHQAVLVAVEQHSALPGLARAIVALMIAFAIAWVMFQVVEKPAARMRKKLSAAD